MAAYDLVVSTCSLNLIITFSGPILDLFMTSSIKLIDLFFKIGAIKIFEFVQRPGIRISLERQMKQLMFNETVISIPTTHLGVTNKQISKQTPALAYCIHMSNDCHPTPPVT